jgi:hypothetical protein
MIVVAQFDGLAIDQDTAASVVTQHAGEDFHQGTLAGAILAGKSQYFTAKHLQSDVVERLDADKGLGDLSHFQERRHG